MFARKMTVNSLPASPWNGVCSLDVLISRKSSLLWITQIQHSPLRLVISTHPWNSHWFVGGSKSALKVFLKPLAKRIQWVALTWEMNIFLWPDILHIAKHLQSKSSIQHTPCLGVLYSCIGVPMLTFLDWWWHKLGDTEWFSSGAHIGDAYEILFYF